MKRPVEEVREPISRTSQRLRERVYRMSVSEGTAPPLSTTPPGWYPDAQHPGGQRYWDGYRWSDIPAPRGLAATAPRARRRGLPAWVWVLLVLLLGIPLLLAGCAALAAPVLRSAVESAGDAAVGALPGIPLSTDSLLPGLIEGTDTVSLLNSQTGLPDGDYEIMEAQRAGLPAAVSPSVTLCGFAGLAQPRSVAGQSNAMEPRYVMVIAEGRACRQADEKRGVITVRFTVTGGVAAVTRVR